MPTNLPEDVSTTKSYDWTHYLSVCPLSRLGTLTNQIYHNNGYKSDEHSFYEIGFNYMQDDVAIYGVFSGSGSARCAKHASLAFPAELLFGQLRINQSSDQIASALRDAWRFVDKQYLASIDDLMLESVRIKIASENLDSQLQSLADPSRLAEITREVHSTASGIVVAIIESNLVLSYAGECVAVLAHEKDGAAESASWDSSVLTCGHTRDNEDEKLRLGEQAMIDLELANVKQTRFLGHPTLKSIPVLQIQPEELKLQIQPNWKFLVLASPGVFEVLSHLNPSCQDISLLADILVRQIREEFVKCSADDRSGIVLNLVSQNVVEELGKMHFRAFSDHQINQKRRPDMTIMIRVFDESVMQHRTPTEVPSSVMDSILSNTMSSIYDTREFVTHSNAPIAAYVDFSSFVERAKLDPSVPSSWLEPSLFTSTDEASL